MASTMKEVAARAGVSTKTVSRVVNDHPSISPQVRERVRRAVDDLGWTPNAQARSLRTGRTGLIALSVVDLRSPTIARLAQALVGEAERHGLQVSLEPSRGRAERIRQTFESRGALFDAVVHVGPLPPGLDLPPLDPERPIVLLGRASADPVALDAVDSDDASAAEALTRHLDMVRRDAVVLLGREERRPDAFLDRLARAFPDAPILRPEFGAGKTESHVADRAAGRRLAQRALDEHPRTDALVCADDELAVGALSLLRERGHRVPHDIALTGYGNIDDGRFSTPSLTTIDLDLPELARRAIELIAGRRDPSRSEPSRTTVPTTVIRAESTLGSTRSSEEVATWRG
ncbi:LacI family DNA-binding transcriptional regulator [Brachybacterium sp.]|uniref:LacI family DNA-binding transcriptional regulator n=1 Tax=Brachybacterium sp. TaxID=1891286 RepID=UPI002ED36763